MRIVSLFVVFIILGFLVLTYFKSTQKTLDSSIQVHKEYANEKVSETTETSIEFTRKKVEELNKKMEDQQKAVEELLDR